MANTWRLHGSHARRRRDQPSKHSIGTDGYRARLTPYADVMDSTNWIIATDAGSYWGKSFGKDGVTFVRANAYHYASVELAAARIAELVAAGDSHAYHVEPLPPARRRY